MAWLRIASFSAAPPLPISASAAVMRALSWVSNLASSTSGLLVSGSSDLVTRRWIAVPPLPCGPWSSSAWAESPRTTASATASACCSYGSPTSPTPPLSDTPARCWTTCAASWAAVCRSGAPPNATWLPVANAVAPMPVAADAAAPSVCACTPRTSCSPNDAWIRSRNGSSCPAPAVPDVARAWTSPAPPPSPWRCTGVSRLSTNGADDSELSVQRAGAAAPAGGADALRCSRSVGLRLPGATRGASVPGSVAVSRSPP